MALLHDKSIRGRTQMGWLDSFHTFSFGGFNDPSRMGHRALRVINEDRVISGSGFGAHEHHNMDIVTYVISGALKHEDSLGNGSVISPGEIQRMSAGTGIRHSEMNASDTDPVHFLQIWIIPDTQGVEPSYEQKPIPDELVDGKLGLVAGRGGVVSLNSDNQLHLCKLSDAETVEHAFAPGRAGFIQIVDGMVEIEGERLSAGDGLQFSDREVCTIKALSDCEILLFDLA
ncbi:MAG: pirin family protein [Pseudomonadota bacterium]